MTAPPPGTMPEAHEDVEAWARAHLRPDERVVWWARPSLLGVVPSLAGFAAVVIAFVVWGVVVPPTTLTGVLVERIAPGGFLMLFAAVAVVQQFVRLRYSAYVVTDKRFYAISSFVTTRVNNLPLSRISKASLKQGVIARMFGLWTAVVSSYGEAGATLVIPAIRNGDRLLAEVNDGLRRGANADWLLRGD